MVMTSAPEPAPSLRVAAAEAEIAATRRRLDLALAATRRDLALPRAAVLAATAALDRAGGAKELGPFIRRHAVPLGLMALAAAWLAMQSRGTPREAGATYARDLIDRARTIGSQAVEAVLSVAFDAAAPGAGDAAPPASAEEGAAPRPSGDDT